MLENEVGGIDTTKPKEVKEKIKELLSWYNSLNNVTIDDIIEFHYRFECIHPFQDGNGRVGRMLILSYLISKNKLDYPCLYLSYYLKRNQLEYYDRMLLNRI